MAKVIERNVPIAEENVTLSGQPATNMFEDWSEEMTDKAENPYDEKSDVPHDKEERKKVSIRPRACFFPSFPSYLCGFIIILIHYVFSIRIF